jgi:nicotinate-nucleotide adenylyltransferase
MTKLCLGGSFNPIHIGHLIVARAVAEARGFGKVVLVPSARPPHKEETADLADACHRLAMCQLVTSCDPFFEVEALELEREGPSYTLETVRALKGRGWGEVAWLIGADMAQILPSWYRIDDLLREATLVLAERPGHVIDWDALPASLGELKQQVVSAPRLDISASAIRARVRAGKSIRYLVTPEVERYILDHRLYGV